MNNELFKDWVDAVWGNHPGGALKRDSSLVMFDAF